MTHNCTCGYFPCHPSSPEFLFYCLYWTWRVIAFMDKTAAAELLIFSNCSSSRYLILLLPCLTSITWSYFGKVAWEHLMKNSELQHLALPAFFLLLPHKAVMLQWKSIFFYVFLLNFNFLLYFFFSEIGLVRSRTLESPPSAVRNILEVCVISYRSKQKRSLQFHKSKICGSTPRTHCKILPRVAGMHTSPGAVSCFDISSCQGTVLH